MKKFYLLLLPLFFTFYFGGEGRFLLVASSKESGEYLSPRLSQLVEANILAVHAYQIGLLKTAGKGDAHCFAAEAISEDKLGEMVEHQQHLLATDREALQSWLRGTPSLFDPARDLEPILKSGISIPEQAPVQVFSHYLKGKVKAPEYQVRALANLYQTILEVDRDGDLLQSEFDFYLALKLPVYVGQLGLPGSDGDFLKAGQDLAALSCVSPFETDAAAWQIAGRKIWNWGEKKLHIRDDKILARELLAEPDMQLLIPKMRNLPPQKIAIIGHSFTMGQHWSSPSSFVPIVTAMFAGLNNRIQFRQFQAGGLTASRALKNFFEDALAWRPDKVLLVVMARNEEDFQALKTMGEGFRQAKIPAYIFDNVHDPEAKDPAMIARFNQAGRTAGFSIVEVDVLLSNAPDRDQFLCLDGIHMKEPYHRLMAKEWLKLLTGERNLNLAGGK
jgi:hypothetical protein